MGLTIQVLGIPEVRHDGTRADPPRGHKAWALLGYLLHTDAPPSRRGVGELLFPDAADPLGAVRSVLARLRRLLGPSVVLRGDPVELDLPADAWVDSLLLLQRGWSDAADLPGLGHPFLDGIDPSASAAFEIWLENERRHIAAAAEGVLHEAALAELAREDTDAAVDLAARLVQLNPLEENAQALYVRCLAAAGHADQALRRVDACVELFRRELAVDPSPALREAAAARPVASRPRGRAAVRAQLEAGEAAFDAGAVSAGLTTLHEAAALAEAEGAPDLVARALVTLGSALVHAARGSDEEGAAVLHRAIEAAQLAGDAQLSATAHRELGYIEFLRGHYERTEGWLARAAELADPDSEELVWILGVRGAARTDTGHHSDAFEYLTEAVERARGLDAARAEAWVGSFLGRLRLLRDEFDAARRQLDRSIEIARGEQWNSFLPWPEGLLADVDLHLGRVDDARVAFEHAFAMGCQLGDPCWESLAARGLGLVAAAEGDIEGAVTHLADAPRRCRRLPDSYRWVEAYAMAAHAEVAVGAGLDGAQSQVSDLEEIASRYGMRELVASAAVLRGRLGNPGAFESAVIMAAQVDNPALARRLDRAEADLRG